MRQRHYETTVILKPEGGAEAIKQFAEKVNSIVENMNGKIIGLHSWGEKRLAYEIKKNLKGHYVYFNHVSNGPLLKELERNFNIWEHVLKFMTVISNDTSKSVETLLSEAKGISAIFERAEERRRPEPRNDESPVEEKKIDNKEYNEKLQRTLSKSADEDDENVEL